MSFDLKLEQGDIQVGNNGDVAKVENSEKLTQDVLKAISTPLGANVFFPWYGSPITQALVGTAFDRRFVGAIAAQQIRTTLERLQELQEEQLLNAGQVVTAQEQIAAIQNVFVDRNTVDPRFFIIELTVLSKAFRRIQETLNISL